MKIRAVICDVYRTLLHVGPPPADAETRWAELWTHHFDGRPPGLEALSARCRAIVAEDHAAAMALGVQSPEVGWGDVVRRALPGTAALPPAAHEDFLYAHAQLLRVVTLMPGATEFLEACVARGLVLGIASNAQRYTLRECAAVGLALGAFDPELTLWSFQLGFSKPNPHVFRILTVRLAQRGIAPAEILMVGDRLDNDVEPARAFGWQAVPFAGADSWREALARVAA